MLAYSTYLGGSGYDWGAGIGVDSSGNAYVAGQTSSPDFPTRNPLQGSLPGVTNVFVVKLSWAAATSTMSLVYSTYLGGSRRDVPHGIAVDSSGNAYVTGATISRNFPTAYPFQPQPLNKATGQNTAFVAKLNSTGSALVYSTYLGGSGDDYGQDIAVDSSGNAYVTGSATSTNFPTAHPLQTSLGGTGATNAFVARIAPFGFSISARPAALRIRAGEIVIYDISLASVGGFAGDVALSYSGLPPHSGCLILPHSLWLARSGTRHSIVLIFVDRRTTPGGYTLTFTGTSVSGGPTIRGLTGSTTVALTVE